MDSDREPGLLRVPRRKSFCRKQADAAPFFCALLAGIVCGCGASAPQLQRVLPPSIQEGWTASVIKVPVANVESTASIVKLPPASRGLKLTGLSSPIPKGGGFEKIGKPYEVKGVLYVPRADPDYEEIGIASWYGDNFHGKMTANGEVYDMNALTAAHRTLPLPSLATVTNVATGRSVIVRINDRGPFKKGRIIDVSARVAKELGFSHHGTAKVRVKYLGPAPLNGDDSREKAHLATLAH